MHHLDIVTGAVRPHVAATRLAIYLRRDLSENRRDHFPGFLRTSGHERWALERTLFAAGNTASDKMNAASFHVFAAALRVGEK